LITLGSAPLEVPEFRAIVLGQLGESKLLSAIETDIAAQHSHARALDADTKGPLKDIHRRVATTILFESSGGQVDKIAHLPELRFALGEAEIDTTSIDNAAYALEAKAFFISGVGSDGYKIYHKATIRKAVSDRRASLDEVAEIKPTMRNLVRKEWDRGATIPIEPFQRTARRYPTRRDCRWRSWTRKWRGQAQGRSGSGSLSGARFVESPQGSIPARLSGALGNLDENCAIKSR
jgi:hypothetical protein